MAQIRARRQALATSRPRDWSEPTEVQAGASTGLRRTHEPNFVRTPCHYRRRTSSYATASVCHADLIDMDLPEYIAEHGTDEVNEYPGRQSITGFCSSLDASKNRTCDDLIFNQPFHVTAPPDNRGRSSECRVIISYKLTIDRFGRPLTIRYIHNGQTFIAKREQVCNLVGSQVSTNRSDLAEEIDDLIWKNLTIWARENEYKWSTGPNAKQQYLKCHESLARYHCSAMYPNCTAEYVDHKPSLPCRDVCLRAKEDCTFGKRNFLDRVLNCEQHPL